MKIYLFSLLLMLELIPWELHAQDNPALEALETLRRGFSASNDFTAQIVQEKKLSLMKRTLVSHGVVRFKKPGLFFMELFPPHASKLLLRDNVMTMRVTGQGTSERIALPPDQSLKRWLDYLEKPLQALPAGMELQAERRGGIWLLQVSPQGKGAVLRLTLDFDRQGTVSRIVIEERNHDRTTISFHALRRNVGLKDKDFQLE